VAKDPWLVVTDLAPDCADVLCKEASSFVPHSFNDNIGNCCSGNSHGIEWHVNLGRNFLGLSLIYTKRSLSLPNRSEKLQKDSFPK
jgi:hypothetical protein